MNAKQLRQSLLLILCALLGIGIIAVYSASSMMSQFTYGQSTRFLWHHLVAIGVGISLGIACLITPYSAIRKSSRWLILLSLLLLVLVLIFGQEVGGAKRWFRFGRWSLQPSELMQLSLVMYLADLLSRKVGVIREYWKGFFPPLVVTALAGALCLMQPDLGTAVVMGSVTLLLLAIANAKWQHLLGLVVLGVIAAVVLIFSAEYRMRRVFAFMDPWQDPRGSGYQIIQSYCAFALGGWTGLGLGASLQKLFYLPSAHTDFIFSIIGEELGVLGTAAVILLFGLFMICGFRLAMLAEDPFSKYLICGLVGMLSLEAMINMAVATGLMPTKGLPLPFISYGGSSMLFNLIACALIFHASRNGNEDALKRALYH